jgi:hypothetical protein
VLGRHIRRIVQNATGVATIAARKLQLKAVDGLTGFATALVALFVASVAAAVAAVLFVLGLRDALMQAAAGRAWVGELGAGLVVLAAVFLGMRWVRARARRGIVESAPGGSPQESTDAAKPDAAAARPPRDTEATK